MIEERAVLECFYGPLWSGKDRARVLDVARGAGATDYVYGPAADERTGGRWREPYGADGEPLRDLNDAAARSGLRTAWRVSPGAPLSPDLAVRCSDPDEQRRFRERIREVAGLGFSRILVAFDDVAAMLDQADRAAFGHDPHPLAAAHATMLNLAADEAYDAGISLLVCPMHYWGVTPSAYRRRLASLLRPDVPVCWTGPGVTSRTISAADAASVAEQWERPLWLWDNYPVNDWDGIGRSFENDTAPRRLPLRALRGRDPDLANVLLGYGANSALDPALTLPATVTALQWALDPRGYDPDQALRDAAMRLGMDPGGVSALAAFAGASPVDASPGGIMELVAAVMSAPADAVAALRRVREWDADLARLARDAHGFDEWVRRAREQLSAASLALSVLLGDEAQDSRLEQASRGLRAEEHSLAHGAVAMLVDWVHGHMGAPPPEHPDDFRG